MALLPETFWAAIKKGVCDIKGKLCPLNADENRATKKDHAPKRKRSSSSL